MIWTTLRQLHVCRSFMFGIVCRPKLGDVSQARESKRRVIGGASNGSLGKHGKVNHIHNEACTVATAAEQLLLRQELCDEHHCSPVLTNYDCVTLSLLH